MKLKFKRSHTKIKSTGDVELRVELELETKKYVRVLTVDRSIVSLNPSSTKYKYFKRAYETLTDLVILSMSLNDFKKVKTTI